MSSTDKSQVRIVLGVAALVAMVAGCGGPPSHNKDPREGRVYTTWSNCAWGSCTSDWKVCVGPDLLVSIDGDKHTAKASAECQPGEDQRP